MKKYVYMMDKQEGTMHMIYYSHKKHYVEEYRDLIEREDLSIIKITHKQLEYYKQDTNNIVDEIIKFKDNIYAPEGEIEMVSVRAEDEMYDLAISLKKIRKQLRMFKGKGAKKLRQAIKEFLDEEVENPSDACDIYAPEWRLLEKIKEEKYTKEHLRKLYDSKGDG